MRSSTYSQAPMNCNELRAGRTQRVNGGRHRLPRLSPGSNPSSSSLSLIKVERQVTISSGEMYQEFDIAQIWISTRSLTDKISFRNAAGGNGPLTLAGKGQGNLENMDEQYAREQGY